MVAKLQAATARLKAPKSPALAAAIALAAICQDVGNGSAPISSDEFAAICNFELPLG